MVMDANITQSMDRIFSDIPTIQYFFERILEKSYVMPAPKSLSTKLYSDSAFSRVFPDVHSRMGFSFPNAIDWIKPLWAIFISPIFLLISFVIVILCLYI